MAFLINQKLYNKLEKLYKFVTLPILQAQHLQRNIQNM
jgi:hypothetical protein